MTKSHNGQQREQENKTQVDKQRNPFKLHKKITQTQV